MWVCPACARHFKHQNQSHSCLVVPIEKHLKGKPETIKQLVHQILLMVEGFGDVQVSSVKHAILVSSTSTFMALKVKKDRVEVEFVLKDPRDGFPVYKVVRVSKHRVAHFVAVGSLEEVDQPLLDLIRKAYEVGRFSSCW